MPQLEMFPCLAKLIVHFPIDPYFRANECSFPGYQKEQKV